MKELKQAWYFTFGANHTTKGGRSLGNSYVVIIGTYAEARNMMFEARDACWAFQYESAGAAGVGRFNLQKENLDEIALGN